VYKYDSDKRNNFLLKTEQGLHERKKGHTSLISLEPRTANLSSIFIRK